MLDWGTPEQVGLAIVCLVIFAIIELVDHYGGKQDYRDN